MTPAKSRTLITTETPPDHHPLSDNLDGTLIWCVASVRRILRRPALGTVAHPSPKPTSSQQQQYANQAIRDYLLSWQDTLCFAAKVPNLSRVSFAQRRHCVFYRNDTEHLVATHAKKQDAGTTSGTSHLSVMSLSRISFSKPSTLQQLLVSYVV